MDHGFRGGPRSRGPPRMPTRGNHQPQPQLIPQQRMMNNNVNPWPHNNIPQHFTQSPDEILNYQQPMGDGYHTPAYSQYPAPMPSPEVFATYPTTPIYTQPLYHPPPMETPQVYPPMPITNKNSRGMQLGRDGIITCSNCRHRNALADSEFVKKDEEIAQLKLELSATQAKLQSAEEGLQRHMNSLQSQGVADAESAMQQSSDGMALSSKSLLSPNAMEFNPILKPQDQTGTASNDSAAEVPVVSAKGVSDEPSSEVQAEDGIGYEPAVEDLVVKCEPKSVQTSPVREEDYQASVKEEEVVDVVFDEPKSEPQDPEPESQPETTEVTKPVVSNEERSEVPQQLNNNNRATNAWGDRSNHRQGSRRGSDSANYGGFGRGKNIRGRDQDHYNNDRNYQKNNRAYQNHNQNYRGSNQRSNDDGGRENWRGSKDWQKPDGQRDTNSPQQRDEPGSQGTSARRWETQSQRSDRNRSNRDETSKDGNREPNHRGQPDADGLQTQGPRGRGGRGPEDNTAKFHYKNRPQDNNKEFTGGSWNAKGGSTTVKDLVMEFKGDLFSAPAEFALAHCVARDFRMGSGIAVKFRTEFKGVSELLDQDVGVGGCAHLNRDGRYIFYMVTKELSNGKPTYDNLRDSLRDLRDKCQRFNVKKLAMPHIGCGLDRLDWGRVKSMINETFQDCDIEVHVYEFNVKADYYKKKRGKRNSRSNNFSGNQSQQNAASRKRQDMKRRQEFFPCDFGALNGSRVDDEDEGSSQEVQPSQSSDPSLWNTSVNDLDIVETSVVKTKSSVLKQNEEDINIATNEIAYVTSNVCDINEPGKVKEKKHKHKKKSKKDKKKKVKDESDDSPDWQGKNIELVDNKYRKSKRKKNKYESKSSRDRLYQDTKSKSEEIRKYPVTPDYELHLTTKKRKKIEEDNESPVNTKVKKAKKIKDNYDSKGSKGKHISIKTSDSNLAMYVERVKKSKRRKTNLGSSESLDDHDLLIKSPEKQCTKPSKGKVRGSHLEENLELKPENITSLVNMENDIVKKSQTRTETRNLTVDLDLLSSASSKTGINPSTSCLISKSEFSESKRKKSQLEEDQSFSSCIKFNPKKKHKLI